MNKNAIILAAGKSMRFAPFTYERPKGLFCVKGEILIERQINQLIEAGIKDIYIVVGYMKEKFFYLENKYEQVHLLINNKFGEKGNLYSLYIAKDYINNTFISYADYYFKNNPFIIPNQNNESYRLCVYKEDKNTTFTVQLSDANVITNVSLSGDSLLTMAGPAYFNETFSRSFVSLMENEINEFRINSLFWEEFYQRHIKELTLYMYEEDTRNIIEFNSIDDLRQFDSDFLYNIDSDIISNICNTINCHPNEISNINVINAGLTNVSFRFYAKGVEYVYRHPGATAGNLINRTSECCLQKIAYRLGLDNSFIKLDLSGWKISYCVQNLTECNFTKYPDQRLKAMKYLRKLHEESLDRDSDVKNFDNIEEALKLMKLASSNKGNLLYEFKEEIDKVKRLDSYLKEDLKRLKLSRCLCHNDIYEPNFLISNNQQMYLIDWEYAGLNDPANDICGFFSRYEFNEDDIDLFINDYLGNDYSYEMYRHIYAFIPVSAFYWIGWGCYKGSVGEDDGFFFLASYRLFHRYIDKALAMFEE